MSSKGKGIAGRGRGRGLGLGRKRKILPLIDQNDETEHSVHNDVSDARGSNHISQARETLEDGVETSPNSEDGTSSQARRTRGTNLGTKLPESSDQRQNILVIRNRFIDPKVIRNLTNDIKGAISDAWPKWKRVPENVKNMLWDHFKTRYKWDDMSDTDMHNVWNQNASSRYSNIFYTARNAAIDIAYEELHCEELGTQPQLINMKGRGPDWLDTTIWDELVEHHWATTEFSKKSIIARKNRMTEKDGSITKHCCGSVPFGSHKMKLNLQRLAKDRDVDDFEVFESTHKRQATGEFVDLKSKRVSVEYRAMMNCSDNSMQPPFNYKNYCEITGGPFKGRLYGIGSHHSFEGTGSRYSSSSIGGNDRISELSKAIEDMQAATLKMVEDSKRREEEENKKREEERKRFEQALEDAKKREEDAKRREDALLELIQKMQESRSQSSSKRFRGK